MMNPLRRISTMVAAVLVASICLPVLAYAASTLHLQYDANTGRLSGVIYSDRETVSLRMVDDTVGTDIELDPLDRLPYRIASGEVFMKEIDMTIAAGLSPEQLIVMAGDELTATANVTDSVYGFVSDAAPEPPEFFGYSWTGINGGVQMELHWDWEPSSFDIHHYNVFLNGQLAGVTKNNWFKDSRKEYHSIQKYGFQAVDVMGQASAINETTIRVPGILQNMQSPLSNLAKGTALMPGQSIVTFSPIGSTEVNGIGRANMLVYLHFFKISKNEISKDDFRLIKADGSKIAIESLNAMDNSLVITIADEWTAGETYTLQLSDTSGMNEIHTTNSNTRFGSIHVHLSDDHSIENGGHYHESGSIVDIVVGDPFPPAKPANLQVTAGDRQVTATWSPNTEPDLAGYLVYLDGVLMTPTPIAETRYTFSNLTNGVTYHVNIAAVDKEGNRSLQAYKWPTPQAASGGFIGGPIFAAPPSEPQQPDVRKVKESDMDVSEGKAALKVEKGTKEIQLSASISAIGSDTVLLVESDKMSIAIPGQVISQLKGFMTTDELKDATISLSFIPVTGEALQRTLEQSELRSNIRPAGEVYDFSLSIVDKDGNKHSLTHFDKPITLKLKVGDQANDDLVGVYYLGDNGVIEYAGGKVKDGYITAGVNHFSAYAVLEYEKFFTDVDRAHWASSAIKRMVAQHVVTGATDTTFEPGRGVTRAEFAAFLARKLGLTATGSATFTDVGTNKWYADEIAAVAEAGIVQGRTDGTFGPNDYLSRQEMVVMLVKAYEATTEENITVAGSETAFSDRTQIAGWAESYVSAAVKLGLVKGRANNRFAPLDGATRAEAAALIAELD